MPDIKKIFYDKPIIIILLLFLVLSCIDIIYAVMVKRAVIYDGSIWFSEIISDRHSFNFEMFWGVRTRGLVNFINTLPINLLIYFIPIKSKALIASIFTLPFFVNNFLLLIFHYFLTLRTKRLDIFLSSLFLYSVIIIPLNLYAIAEISLATSILMLLFHYLVADIDYKKKDVFFIVILTVISYLSTEAIVYCGVILFFISLYIARKTENKKSALIKRFIGINCLCMSVFQLILFHHFSFDYVNSARADLELSFYKEAIKSYYCKLDVFFSALFAAAIFSKIRFEKIFIITLSIISAVFFIYTVKTGDYVSSGFFGKRFFPYILLPVIFIINTFITNRINTERANVLFSDTTLVILFWGCLNLLFSINNSYVFNTSIKELTARLEKSQETFVSPDTDLSDFYASGKPAGFLFNCDTYMYDSINFSNEYKQRKLIIPSTITGCPNTFYFTDTKLMLPFSELPITCDYWDLTELKKSFE